MKLSIVISTQPASFSALAYKGQLEENIAKIKKFGYNGVELAVRDPEKLDIELLKSSLQKNNLPVCAIGTGQAFGEDGLSFTNQNKEIRKKAVERIKSHVRFSELFSAIVIIGLIRGRRESGVSCEQAENWLIESLAECASVNENIRFAIEPINRYETNLINTVESGLSLIEKVNMKNIGLLLDTFHMNIEEPSIAESILKAKRKLFHFHVADSNRWYPGAGHIDFRKVFKTLKEIKYSGFISAEIMPIPNSDTAAEKTIKHISKF